MVNHLQETLNLVSCPTLKLYQILTSSLLVTMSPSTILTYVPDVSARIRPQQIEELRQVIQQIGDRFKRNRNLISYEFTRDGTIRDGKLSRYQKRWPLGLTRKSLGIRSESISTLLQIQSS